MRLRHSVLFLFVVFALIHSNMPAQAGVCGGINNSGIWTCNPGPICPTRWWKQGQFPDRATCLRSAPGNSAKAKPEPAKKQIAAKKPVKPLQKAVEPAPRPKKPVIVAKKGNNKLPSEPDQTKLTLETQTTAVKLDRDLNPAVQEPQPIVTAKLSPLPEPLAAADKQTLGRRIALIIGNSSYAAVPALKNPAMDARAIADTLTSLGFEKVTLKLDLDRQATWAALAEFAEDAARADWAVVYYAGHGIELDAQNYIIPVDAKLDSDRRVLFETIPLDHVVEATAGARKFRLVILDACRNNPFLASMTRVASTRSIGRGLSRVEPQGGVLVAYAAKAGEIALDGDGGNSPFVVALIEQLRRPGVEVGFLFRKVRDSVLKQTNGTQEPYTYGSLPGDEEIYFRPPSN